MRERSNLGQHSFLSPRSAQRGLRGSRLRQENQRIIADLARYERPPFGNVSGFGAAALG